MKAYAPHREHILSFNSSPYENREKIEKGIKLRNCQIKLRQILMQLIISGLQYKVKINF